ncbi:uncharacterized protein LOC142227364 [Haematobia irritans]|uniref:uncharacterized protein LOC142227364 n=1 Tax=Haematobia irritans TaxID=7368 RepID=UPI003F50C0D6
MYKIHTNLILAVMLLLLRSSLNFITPTNCQRYENHPNNHHHHHHHKQQHHHIHGRHQLQDNHPQDYEKRLEYSHYRDAPPRLMEGGTTTKNPLPLIDDNELTNKQQSKEDLLILYKGRQSMSSAALSSSTSTPSWQYHHQKPHLARTHHQTNGQHLILTSPGSFSSSPTSSSFSNFVMGPHHTQYPKHRPHYLPHQQSVENTRLVPTPLPSYSLASSETQAAATVESPTTQKYNKTNDTGGHQRNPLSKAIKTTSPAEHSKFSSSHSGAVASMELDHHYSLPPQGKPQKKLQHSSHLHHQKQDWSSKHDYDEDDLQIPAKDEEDYYEDYNEGEDDVTEDSNDDDDDDDDDIDSFIDDTDNNLSDRSYARITRSKLDDDYVDDEPYRNAVEDQMQRDSPPGVLTEQKFLEVGNEKAVQQARERYIQEQKRPRTPHEMATEHWQRMIQATKCRKPLPRVIPISNNTSKRYEPYATILHRCGEDTGCCGSTASVCTVKRQEIVLVYVFSYDFNYRKEIEALPMQNHTECHCVNRASLQYESMPRGKRSGSWLHNRTTQNQRAPKHHQQQHHQYQQQQQQSLVARSDMKYQPHIEAHPHHNLHHHTENMLSCHCPRHFTALEEDVERHAHLPRPHTVLTRKCRCDCLPHNQTCLRFKQGEEGFSLEDRKCISEHDCKPPVCAYGDYNVPAGRCPSSRSHIKPTF